MHYHVRLIDFQVEKTKAVDVDDISSLHIRCPDLDDCC